MSEMTCAVVTVFGVCGAPAGTKCLVCKQPVCAECSEDSWLAECSEHCPECWERGVTVDTADNALDKGTKAEVLLCANCGAPVEVNGTPTGHDPEGCHRKRDLQSPRVVDVAGWCEDEGPDAQRDLIERMRQLAAALEGQS